MIPKRTVIERPEAEIDLSTRRELFADSFQDFGDVHNMFECVFREDDIETVFFQAVKVTEVKFMRRGVIAQFTFQTFARFFYVLGNYVEPNDTRRPCFRKFQTAFPGPASDFEDTEPSNIGHIRKAEAGPKPVICYIFRHGTTF